MQEKREDKEKSILHQLMNYDQNTTLENDQKELIKYKQVQQELKKYLTNKKELYTFFQLREGEQLKRADFVSKLDAITDQDCAINLASRIYDNLNAEILPISAIEDFALGFYQDEVKLFMFGKSDQRIFAFQQKKLALGEELQAKFLDTYNDSESNYNSDSNSDDPNESNKQNQQAIVCYPAAINFPRQTHAIAQVSCGQAHVLALTTNYKMFSWGAGNYGALGFGSRQDQLEPKELQITKSQIEVLKITCGRLHSVCLVKGDRIFSWGNGLNGRLGHGDTEDVLEPKEIQTLFNAKVIDASAGESHSAAVTINFKLYTWGNGVYGRLGHGNDQQELKPKLVEFDNEMTAVSVSCGAFHTIFISKEGQMFGFGQDKFGKLGGQQQTKSNQQVIKYYPVRIQTYQAQSKNNCAPSEDLICCVVAGVNHNLALSFDGKVFSWGYNGYNLTARKSDDLTTVNYQPQQILTDYRKGLNERKSLKKNSYHNVEVKAMLKHIEELVLKNSEDDNQSSTQAKQVGCTQLNTAVVTNAGELYICGSNSYNQIGIKDSNFGVVVKEYYSVPFFKSQNIKVESISCGAEHLFAMTRDSMVYGWGRNDSGQLGIGSINKSIEEPRLIEFKDISIKKIVCGDNYSACITSLEKIVVAGELDGGKLGLGKSSISGYIQEFQEIPGIMYVQDIACGPNHMLAIIKESVKRKTRIFSWGRNWRGQLGNGSKDDSHFPVEVKFSGENEFIKVACGRDFSLALNNQQVIFVWGNPRYACLKFEEYKDIEEQKLPKELNLGSEKSIKFKDIACSYHYCLAQSNENKIFVWGQLMKEFIEKFNPSSSGSKDPESKLLKGRNNSSSDNSSDDSQDENSESNSSDGSRQEQDNFSDGSKSNQNIKKKEQMHIKEIQKFPFSGSNRDNVVLSNFAIGQNHVASISCGANKFLYCWGYNDCLQMGPKLSEKENANLRNQPIPINSLNTIFEKNNQLNEVKFKQGNQDKETTYQENLIENRNAIQMHKQIGNQKENLQEVKDQNQQNKTSQQQKKYIDADEETKQIITQKQIKVLNVFDERSRPNLVLLKSSNNDKSTIEGHIKLKEVLKKEIQDGTDEKAMMDRDRNMNDQIERLVDRLQILTDLERQRKVQKLQMKNNLLQRITQNPFFTEPSSDPLITNTLDKIEEYKIIKKSVKQAFLNLQIHPCYLIKLYESQKVDNKLFFQILKAVYPNKQPIDPQSQEVERLISQQYLISSESERLNYLLICIITKIIPKEFEKYKTIDEVDLQSNESLVGNLFKYIFKSQATNIDTIATFVAHLINSMIKEFQVAQTDDQNLAQKKKKNDETTKLDLNLSTEAFKNETSMEKYFNFLETYVINDLIEDSVMMKNKGAAQFVHRKKVEEFIKTQQNQENAQKFPGIRLSSEIGIFLELIVNELEKKEINGLKHKSKEDQIAQKILNLVFYMLPKVWQQQEIYLFPYLKNKKMIQLLTKAMKNKEGYYQLIELVISYFSGAYVFPKYQENQPVQNLNYKINHDLYIKRIQIFRQQIMSRSNRVGQQLCSFKQLENLVKHSLQNSNFKVSIHSELLYKLLKVLNEAKETVALTSPVKDDQLFNAISKIKPKTLKTLNCTIQVKIASRLFCENQVEVLKCINCNCTLTEQFFALEKTQIVQECEPEDKESLFSIYCFVVKNFTNIIKEQSYFSLQINEQIEQITKNDDEREFEWIRKATQMKEKIESEIMDKNEKEKKEEVELRYNQLLQQAEKKINYRRKHLFMLNQISNRINEILIPVIQSQLQYINEETLIIYKTSVYNVLYGLANLELRKFAPSEQKLEKMRSIQAQLRGQQFSKSLFKLLQDDQKMALRSVLRKPFIDLLNSKTITEIKLKSLSEMAENLILLVMETAEQEVELKVIYQEVTRGMSCFKKKSQEQTLLTVELKQQELMNIRKQVRQQRIQVQFLKLKKKNDRQLTSDNQGQGKTKTDLANEKFKRVIYQNALEFDTEKLLQLISEMLIQRYAYVFQSEKTPQEMIKMQQ